jgi:hypothetical protein
MMNHNLTFEALLDWAEGRLAESQAARTTAAAAHDEAAQEIVEWIRLFEQVSDELVLVEPPASVHHDLEQLFPAVPEAEEVVREPILA